MTSLCFTVMQLVTIDINLLVLIGSIMGSASLLSVESVDVLLDVD